MLLTRDLERAVFLVEGFQEQELPLTFLQVLMALIMGREELEVLLMELLQELLLQELLNILFVSWFGGPDKVLVVDVDGV